MSHSDSHSGESAHVQTTLDPSESLANDPPEYNQRIPQYGPWNLAVRPNDRATIRDNPILSQSVGHVVGGHERLLQDLEDADEIEMPSADELVAKSRKQERADGSVVLEPGTDRAERATFDPYPNTPTRFQIRWENVEAAVRTLLCGKSTYDPDEFTLYDCGIHGFALVRECGIGDPEGPGRDSDAVVVIAPNTRGVASE